MATLDQIEDYIRRREFTDYIMPIWLPFLPLLLIIGGLFWLLILLFITTSGYDYYYDYHYHYSRDIVMSGVLATYFIIAIVATAINVYVVYKWVNRRNEHFKRQRLLFRAITDYLKSKGCEVSRLGIYKHGNRSRRERKECCALGFDTVCSIRWRIFTLIRLSLLEQRLLEA